ncbi:MAG: aspartate--tRNA ligase [Clostridia bacterium]|nr:aspartate--tRNA ligase [Clostridia bacterium]
MAETLQGFKRTNYANDFDSSSIGQTVSVAGWVNKQRDIGSLVFIDLRDRTGLVQIVFDETINVELLNKAKGVHNEYVIAVKGTVRQRSGAFNKNIKTGEIEIVAEELRVLSVSEPTPFVIASDVEANDQIKLKYRYLDLRRPEMQKNIIMRHKIAKIARDYYDENGFLEIETPYLTKSTPEGARDYLVPSRVHPEKFYALPQSPQLYKQLLMLSGFDRYIQIARCFRDEDLRADRQPEFTQIDLEMSFVEMDDVIAMNEGFLKRVFKEVLDMDIQTPFMRMDYKEAMERYGSDKPDNRFGLELVDLSEEVKDVEFTVFQNALQNGGSVKCINGEGMGAKLSRKEIDALGELVKTYGGKGLAYIVVNEDGVKSPIAKFMSEEQLDRVLTKANAKPGDIILIVADKTDVVYTVLGSLRCDLAKKFELYDENSFSFLWVVNFPLLEFDEEENRYVAKHHPFTAPMDEDLDKLETAPGEVRAKAYDIVLNGNEIGGGSIRIFDTKLQEKMFQVLGFTKEAAQERFGFLIDAFRFGPPPHGGMAYGLDRLCMLMAGCDSIRDVIAFPKVQNASELMTNAPDFVDEKQLADLNIVCVKPEKEEPKEE